MAKYLSPLIVEKAGPQLWKLYKPLVYQSDLYKGIFIAPEGTITNFASIPRIFWRIFPPVDIYDPAAVTHDAGYHGDLVTENGERINTVKHVADNIFREALIACGVSEHQAHLMYLAVSKFGSIEAQIQNKI